MRTSALSVSMIACLAAAGWAVSVPPPARAPRPGVQAPPPPVPVVVRRAQPAQRSIGGMWASQGFAPASGGQSENAAPGNAVAGAVNAVAPHPTDPDTLYVGAINGGIWKTTNAQASAPTWIPLTDGAASLSIGALEFDPTDGTHNTLVGGIGRFSSFQRRGGPLTGLLRTTDGGTTWSPIDGGGLLLGKNVAAVAARGSTLVVGVNLAEPLSCAATGVFRSIDGGATFTAPTVGMPRGVVFDVAGDPTSSNVLYASVLVADVCSGMTNGVYKSSDTGASWTLVSDAAMNALISNAVTSNIEVAVGTSHNVYVAILNSGRLAGVFRSGNGGATWAQMDTPETNENGTPVGINPDEEDVDSENPGGQGGIHFSIVADPADADVVYVGGDRQPTSFGDTGGFPNSIGAFNYSGRLFRGDAGLPPGSQWAHLTHSNALGAPGGGTASSSAPHADSRDMAFDAAGEIIEADDGGVWRRTSPQTNTGDWFSLNSHLQVGELHDVAYDGRSSIVFAGTQDNGTPVQSTPDSPDWALLFGGDGGDVAVDDTSTPALSTRFGSAQNLQAFFRAVYDGANALQSMSYPSLTVTGGGAVLVPRFSTALAVNRVDPSRLVFVGDNSIYESLDGGATLTEIGPGLGPNEAPFFTPQNAIAAGGRRLGSDAANILYVGSAARVLVRTTGPLAIAASYPGTTVYDVIVDPDDWMVAYAIDATHVYRTADAGGTWSDVTGDLFAAGAGALRQLAYVPRTPSGLLVVASDAGVFAAWSDALGTWQGLGSGLPNVPVWDLDYRATDDVLVAGTLGRGAWKLTGLPQPPPGCGATPVGGCLSARKSIVLLKNSNDDDKDKLLWKWIKGAALSPLDLGNPMATTAYRLCLYAGTANALVATAQLPSGSGWQPSGSTGYKFKGATVDGLTKALLKAGASDKSKAQVKGQGAALPDPSLPLPMPVTVQLQQAGSPFCLQSQFLGGEELHNDSGQFKAKHQQ